jgi:beta-xylosidase
MKLKPISIIFLLLMVNLTAQNWIPDLRNGLYKNPILFADYSDPDVIRVNDDYYLVASSFNCMPGIPVLRSRDLVNWTIIGHVYDKLPFEKYNKPAHGEGSWAPSIRFHNGLYYVYFCTPFEGLFVATAENPAGPWQLEQVVAVEMWEDPCPFWDDDGNAYLVRSKLRADILYLHRMTPDGKQLLDNGKIIYHDVSKQPTIEGPKFFKKDGYYYILAPAGGVPTGWQTVLRSKNIYGPYEDKIVLHQGNTAINGPHQGGLVETQSGEWWFVHFQDRGAYGRIVHLEPVHWQEGWLLMGVDLDSNGIGEPVGEYQKPDVGKSYPIIIPQTSDEFDSAKLGLQWQWHANPQEKWFSLSEKPGCLRLYSIQNLTQNGNLWFVPNLLLQKFPAPAFSATTEITMMPDQLNEKAGLVVMGEKWAFIALSKTDRGLIVGMYTGTYDRENDATELIEAVPLKSAKCQLKITVDNTGQCLFYYSLDGNKLNSIGKPFSAAKGRWISAKVGLFNINPNMLESKGYADFDWFRIE